MDIWKALNKSELISAGLLIALGATIVVQASGWVYLTPDGPGPGFFPIWTGSAIIVLSVVVAFRHVLDVIRRQSVEKANWKDNGRVLLCWTGLAVAAALLKPAGFVASFTLLGMFMVLVIYRKSLIAALCVGAGSAAGFWVLFVKILQVQLPVGPWGF